MKLLPKAELHAHLNGSIPTFLIKALITEYKIALPKDFDLNKDLQCTIPVRTLREYFKPWLALKRLPIGKVCLQRMIDSACAKKFDDGVRYVEFRISPFHISEINNISLDETLEWLLEASRASQARTSLRLKWIISLSRYNFNVDRSYKLMSAIKRINTCNEILALDLSGDEDSSIPNDASILFKHAKQELGLGITIHAGETGSIENVVWAIESCNADRISHALSVASHPRIMDILCNKSICIETCLVSNLMTNANLTIENHPVKKFVKHGVPFVLCSDNSEIHGLSLSDEYELFLSTFGFQHIIDRMYEEQRRFAFGDFE